MDHKHLEKMNFAHGLFFSKCRLTKSLCTEPKPVSVFKNNQFKEKAQENELDEQQS